LADSFIIQNYMPDVKDLKEGISMKDFVKEYGSLSDIRFQKIHSDIQKRIQSLPGYKKMGTDAGGKGLEIKRQGREVRISREG
jgi:hypothetical protein